MTADFTQIFMPHYKKGGASPNTSTTESKDSLVSSPLQSQYNYRNASSSYHSLTKWLFVTMLLFIIIGVTVVTTGVLVRYEDKLERYKDKLERYEDKLERYEDRISTLEKDLERVMKSAMTDLDADEEVEYETHADQDPEFGYDDEDEDDVLEMIETPKEFKHDSGEQEERFVRVGGEHFGKVELQKEDATSPRSRRKRQITYPNVPTFGPEVERTGSGVPIIEQSYLSSAGVTLNPRILSSSTDNDGLTLYERLVERDGSSSSQQRNRDSSLRSQHQPHSSLRPHHQVSAAWSEPQQSQTQTSQSQQRSRIQLKSGDNSGFGSSSSSSSETGTSKQSSRRSQHYSSYRGTTSTSNSPVTSSNSNIFVAGGGSGSSGATYHRNSRVPSTGDYFYPGTSTTSGTKTFGSSGIDNPNTRIQYPPLRKMSVGNGEGEVIARVLQTELDTDGDNAFASANLGSSEAVSSRRVYRARHHNVGLGAPQTSTSGGTGGGVITSHAQTQSYSGRADRRKFGGGRKTFVDQDSGEVSIVKAEAWVEGPKPLAAHYVADVSNYTTAHRNYDGNGRLRNADGIFEAWRPAEWMTAEGAGDGKTKNFVLSPNGVLTIKKAGLYYIYAQIHYLDEHDINGFIVQVNTDPFLQCTTMTESYNAGSKSNSCFTAGIQYLKAEDRILLKDIETNRYSIFKPEKSFFGLMKVGAVP